MLTGGAPRGSAHDADARRKEAARRNIYLRRMLGDDASSSKAREGKSVSWMAALTFAVYVAVASFVIIRRSTVEWRSEAWLGSITGIYLQPFSLSPVFKYFDDISTPDDVLAWLEWFTWSIAISGDHGHQQSLSLVGFNRVMPAEDKEAVMYMTYRRMKLSDSSTDPATTSRFQPLYPSTWLASDINAGVVTGDFEDTDLLVSGNFTWRYEPGLGYKQHGGYIAKIVLPISGSIDDGYVQVNDQKMGLLDFRAATWFGPTFASMALEMALYNANYQSISRVSLIFNARESGLLVKPQIDSRSILLDIHDPITDIVDIAYLLFTSGSFFLLAAKACNSKGDRAFFVNTWTYVDLLSVVFSLGQFITWQIHISSLQVFLENATAYKNHGEVSSVIEYFSFVYCRVAAIATLLIYWRSLKFLSRYNFRLRRLGRSFALMSGKLVAYGCYVCVMFLGFFAFAMALFGSSYHEMHRLGYGLATFMEMFFGDITEVLYITAPVFRLFLVGFMIVMYIVCVQMFNAIINYAYNRVSEDMQAQIDRERRQAKTEKTRKDLQRKLLGKRSLVTKVNRRIYGWLWPAAAKEQAAAAAGAEGAPKRRAQDKAHPALEHLDDEMREKVNKLLNTDDHQHSTFKIGTVFIFFLYAITYFWFQSANTPINPMFEVGTALESSIKPVAIAAPQRGGQIQYIHWDQLFLSYQARAWLQDALAEVLFKDPPADGPPWCLANWNCVIYLQNANASKEMVLLTAVRRAAEKNDGCLETPCTDGRTPFIGGPELVLDRQSPEGGGGRQTCTDAFDVANISCSTSCTGGELEIKCSLDVEHSAYISTMGMLTDRDFFAYNTRSLKAEFAVFNGNYNFVSLVTVEFDLQSNGRMTKSIDLHTMAIFDLEGGAREIAETLARRVLPGVLCLCFSIYFSASLLQELNRAFIRRSKEKNEDGYESRLSIALDFFTGDLFNLFEMISVLISLAAAAFFAVWCVKDIYLKGAMEGNLVDFLTYLREMTFWHKLFVRLSGVNLLLLFVRPLKFLKDGNNRIALLWKTLFDARQDIFWFVVMMSVIMTGFMMFAWMSFGERYQPCSTFKKAAVHCAEYLFGRFEYLPLYRADPVMAALFHYPYVLICYILFSNTLFAIIDRYFVTNDPPNYSLKRRLKPFFGRLLRFIEWDNDHTMIQDPQIKKEEGPPTRAKRVRDFAQRIATIRETGDVNAEGPAPSTKKAKGLPEVCDVDERMQEVLSWSRDEAKKTVNDWNRMALEKYSFKNEAAFIETVMQGKVGGREGFEAQEAKDKDDMEDAFRQMHYAREVHETMAERDQRTLAQYITALEQNIQEELVQESALRHEVVYLREESQRMGSAPEEPLDPAGGAQSSLEAVPARQRLEGVLDGSVQDGESDDSDDDW